MAYYKLLILLSVTCTCSGNLRRLGGILTEAHNRIHSRVHDVAGAVLGGFHLNIGGHATQARPPVHQQPNSGQGETVIVIVEETSQGNYGHGQPQAPYRPPPQNHYGHPNTGHQPNHGCCNHHHNNPGNGPYQNGQNTHGNHYGLNPNLPTHPNQNANGQGFPNQYGQGGPRNKYPTNNNYHNNGNPNQNGYGIPNNNGYGNNANQNENRPTNPEQNKPNLNGNYKPTEANNGQQPNDVHNVVNTQKETNDKTTKKPTSDGPLFVPLDVNSYNYNGDKISINAPKRDTDKTSAGAEDNDEDFAIDIRLKDE